MERPQFARLVVSGLISLLVLALATPAAAARPLREVIPPAGDFTEESCGFPVLVHQEGYTIRLTFYDKNDEVLRTTQTYPQFKVTLTNLETGKSLRIVDPGPGFFDEGTLVGSGPWFWGQQNPVTGEPGMFLTYGRFTLDFDTGAISLNGRIRDLCAELAG